MKFIIFLGLLLSSHSALAQTISARVETALVLAHLIPSWQNKGTGLIRAEKHGVQWQQDFIAATHNISQSWQVKGLINLHSDGEKHVGFTQAYFQYKPLSPNNIKFKSKIGLFYPAMSIENTSEGWLSPYTYTQSEINSWIG